jgi:hypothetical protein
LSSLYLSDNPSLPTSLQVNSRDAQSLLAEIRKHYASQKKAAPSAQSKIDWSGKKTTSPGKSAPPAAEQSGANEAFGNRLVDDADVEGELLFDPIDGLDEVPLLSLEEAIQIAEEDPKFLGKKLKKRAKMALMFARNLLKKSVDERLSVDEIAAIQIYTQESAFFKVLNARLRSSEQQHLKRYFFPYLKLFLTGLYKLPFQSNTMVFRGVKRDLSEHFEKGTEVVWWSISSCTTHIEALAPFLGPKGDRTQFFVSTVAVVDVSRYSAIKKEREVILPPGSELCVQSMHDVGHGLCQIQLKQMEYEPLLDVELKWL